MRDLVLLVPDKNTEFTIRGALTRHQALGIRQIDFQILVEQGRDGGVRRRGAQVLNVLHAQFSHAAMVMDYEGSGADVSANELEARLDGALADAWGDRAKAIVIEPEVDAWMWGAETHLRSTMNGTSPKVFALGSSLSFSNSPKTENRCGRRRRLRLHSDEPKCRDHRRATNT